MFGLAKNDNLVNLILINKSLHKWNFTKRTVIGITFEIGDKVAKKSRSNTVVLVQTSLRSHATARNPCTYKYGNLCNDIFKTKFHMTARLPLLLKE